MEESPKMVSTNGKVRRKLNETLSHGVSLMVRIGLWRSRQQAYAGLCVCFIRKFFKTVRSFEEMSSNFTPVR